MKKKATILFSLLFVLFTTISNAKNNETSLISPPANDDCVNATTLTINPDFLCATVTSGTVADATASTAPNSCPLSSTNGNDDVWFKFEATAADHKIELLNISGSQTDLYHMTYDGGSTSGGDCSTMTAIFCSDPETSTLSGLTIGNTYFIRVFTDDANSNDTTFDICVGTEPGPPANDECANAESITTFPYNNTIDASSATNTGGFVDATGCGGAMNDGVWYTLVGNGENITVNVVPTAWDAKIAVYSGSCGTFTCTEFTNNGLTGNTEMLTFTATMGTTYFINIGHPSGTTDMQEATFDLDITSVVLSLEDLKLKGFAYYPNPVRNKLKIRAKETIKSISVYNMIGQHIKTITPSGLSAEVNMSNLSSGVYFIKAEVGGSVGSFKIIKK